MLNAHYDHDRQNASGKLLAVQCLLLVLFLCLGLLSANADPKRKSINLSATAALHRANSISSASFLERRSLAIDSVTWVEAVRDEFAVDSVGDNVGDSTVSAERRNSTFLSFRNAYIQRDIEDNRLWRYYDESGELDDMAQKVTIYQGASQLSKAIVDSSFGQFLREAAAEVDQWRKTISLRFGRDQRGDVSVGNGTSRSDFLELSLSSSPRRLLEPRLKLGRNLILKYDILESRPVLEYSTTF